MLARNLAAILAAVLLTAQLPFLGAQFTHRSKSSILDVVKANGLDTLTAALEAAGLDATLDDVKLRATLLAPSEEAFATLLEELGVTAEELLGNTELLQQVLSLHLIPDQRLKAADLANVDEVTTAAGVPLVVDTTDGVAFIGPAGPPGSKVVQADLGNCAGVVHVIDRVLLPGGPADPAQSGRRRLAQDDEEVTDEVAEACKTIAEVAEENGLTILSTGLAAVPDLLTAVQDSEFVATVLAPTDQAFAELLEGLDGIDTPEQLVADAELLTSVLQLHIIPDAKVTSTQLVEEGIESVDTLLKDDDGNPVPLAVDTSDGVKFTSPGEVTATVTVPDVDACAAIVHVIDAVLLP